MRKLGDFCHKKYIKNVLFFNYGKKEWKEKKNKFKLIKQKEINYGKQFLSLSWSIIRPRFNIKNVYLRKSIFASIFSLFYKSVTFRKKNIFFVNKNWTNNKMLAQEECIGNKKWIDISWH